MEKVQHKGQNIHWLQKTYIQLILLWHYSGANSYLFVNGTEIYKFKAKDSEIVEAPLCLENVSKDWSIDNIKKLDWMVMFMILVWLWCNCSWRYIRHPQIFNEKELHSVIECPVKKCLLKSVFYRASSFIDKRKFIKHFNGQSRMQIKTTNF